jgi:hypothetical protein
MAIACAALAMLCPAPCAGNRTVEYVRGNLVEWYENAEGGIEQGFIISRSPHGSGPVEIRGLLGGDLEAVPDGEGRGVSFRFEGKEVLRYGSLRVVDAEGRELASEIELEDDVIVIVIEEGGAYPILVDQLLTTPYWTTLGGGDNARYGTSVSGAGDVNGDGHLDVIVGTPMFSEVLDDAGRAYLFYGGEDGLSETAGWVVGGEEDGDQFGYSVACAGNVNGDDYSDVVVGAYFHPEGADEGGQDSQQPSVFDLTLGRICTVMLASLHPVFPRRHYSVWSFAFVRLEL